MATRYDIGAAREAMERANSTMDARRAQDPWLDAYMRDSASRESGPNFEEFMKTPEAQLAGGIRAGGGGGGANALYNELFGRDIDEAGAAFYDSKGYSDAELREVLMASAEREFYNDSQNTDVDRAFNAMLGRDAYQEGEEFYKDYTYDEIIAAIRGEEGAAKFAGSDLTSEYERYAAGGTPEGYTGPEENRPIYAESEGGDPYRNQNTNPYSAEELAAREADRQEDRFGWDQVKPWNDPELLGNSAFQQGGGTQGVDRGYDSTFIRTQTSPEMSNRKLYDTQLGNLMGQQNDFQNQQAQAAGIRAANAAKPPVGAPQDPWSWYNEGKGLPDRSTPAAAAPPAGAPAPTAPAAGAGAQLTPQQQAALAAQIGNINIGI